MGVMPIHFPREGVVSYQCGSCSGAILIDHTERRGVNGTTGHLHWHTAPACKAYRAAVTMPAEVEPRPRRSKRRRG